MSSAEFTSNKPYLFRAILDWLLDNNATPYILVDTSKNYVEVPEEHIKDQQIVLNIKPSAVQNWMVDNEAISFSARFSGAPRQIYVPMNALLAVYSQENGQGMVFPIQDIEVEEPLDEVSDESITITELTAVPGSAKHTHGKGEEKNKNSKKPSHLKIIK